MNNAGDALNTNDEAEFALYDHVQVADLKLHKGGVLEDAVPTLTHVFPADQGNPTWVDAHGPVRVLPDTVHAGDVQVGEGFVEPLIGGFYLFDDLRFWFRDHQEPRPRPARFAQYSHARCCPVRLI